MALSLNVDKGVYVPTTWKDGTGSGNFTPITPDRLNHIETGIQAAQQDCKALGDFCDSISQVLPIAVSGFTDKMVVSTAYESAAAAYTIVFRFDYDSTTSVQIVFTFNASEHHVYLERHINGVRNFRRTVH